MWVIVGSILVLMYLVYFGTELELWTGDSAFMAVLFMIVVGCCYGVCGPDDKEEKEKRRQEQVFRAHLHTPSLKEPPKPIEEEKCECWKFCKD